MPTGKVKWYDTDKGFGFLSQEGGEDVYVRSSALPDGVDGLKQGQRVEFSMAAGRRGPQALTVTVLEPAPSVSRGAGAQRGRRPAADRRPAEDLNVLIEDMIQLLDVGVQPELRKGRYPDRKASEQIAKVLREIARELDS
ncbi:cold-shock protein [Tsukamurella pulmonis]|uniref:Cold-shock DNA-binding protein family n=1 Tax=Tsukamurella pulmonis TaxID=47312 RepID=A0A1H1HB99_9ACTN|nr:cold-shock protein [Tsukamurella pulmonis]KXO94881.1 cold-shock protein [Tsukamurella pulmonis]KXP12906.1 cold-shock protein [Tsukamurella pulmonis]SDR22663.1 cold-shock DNA-binding protein family [Tsukamurella pulmonis]SUP15344.1 Cold shock-like protein CspD [Tsukamurella pulmonis]BDD81075.1 cold-shock protein [Tsukamurella pulmonis]